VTALLAGYLLLQTLVHTTTPAAPAPPPPVEHKGNPESLAFFADRNAQIDVEKALNEAKISSKNVLIILGANWCHDSIGLAGWLDSPRFMALMRDRYVTVYVDVGTPQIGKGRNLDIAKRFGIKRIKGTPVVMVVSADGKLLNSEKDALSWRNAASRREDDIFRYFDGFTPT
jgi:thioredoxin-related protein